MLSEEFRKILLKTASDSIQHGLAHGEPMPVHTKTAPPELRVERATFVTLDFRGHLRGCIGTLEAERSLIEDVAANAFQAAFSDPRFPPLRPAEFKDLEIHISVLSPPEPMQFESEEDFLNQLRPGVDGIVLRDGWRRGTFLPAVWEDLPEKKDFVQHLKMKAGLPPNYWSPTITASRYTAEYFP
jgi:AmmeMemoRadiSam system protein A